MPKIKLSEPGQDCTVIADENTKGTEFRPVIKVIRTSPPRCVAPPHPTVSDPDEEQKQAQS